MPKTVKVRVALAVDPEGDWYAVGWSPPRGEPVSDREKMAAATEMVGEDEARYWLTAEVPVPTPEEKEIKASVEEDA